MRFRVRLALRLLAWASWALPEDHPAIDAIHAAAVALIDAEQ